ncbi:ABC-three component system protein [Myroides odoratimimus]|uniref:ABC-three component system protein n=1 Tax=Myroides odoratimimus TaxID=76832 RepID=UPI002DB96BCA|nr:ABC-three component system protein [Myroides odoratimimus]MEC4027437.1 ABC-three component system protein [Myroides odoratimimus]
MTDFSAKEPSLGYIYQIKYALLLLLKDSRNLENPILRIECLDDIDITDVNTTNLYQTKLHIKSKANLTDSSVDFWKTIRIWSQYISDGTIDINQTVLNLITTENIPTTSILHKLKEKIINDVELLDIIKKLDEIAISSTSESTKKGREEYQKLSIENKRSLIERIRIFDNSVNISDIDAKIKKELIHSCYRNHLDAFLEILDGWWLSKAIKNLTGDIDSIKAEELEIRISSIRDSFQADNLPNHFNEQMDISDEDVNNLKDKNLLKQLELISIKINSRTVKRAISDFRRAFEQRSKWLRLQLLNPEEEEEYDKRLRDHWKNIFDLMSDEADGKGEDELIKLGKEFYLTQFANNCPQIKIREKFNEDYLTRGSYQILSDEKKIGWHPNFDKEL